MKKVISSLFVCIFIFASTISFAEQKYYIEGQINYTQVDDVDTNTYSGSSGGYTFSNFKGTIDYDSDIGYGVEFGASGILNNDNLRIGISYVENKIEYDNGIGSGTVTDGTTTVDFAVSASRSDLDSIGLNLDNDVKVYSLNAYYDFNVFAFKPFLGVGLGQADIKNAKDKELAKTFYVGSRFSINEQAYVGLKGTYSMIDGPEDRLGVKYDDITAYGVTLSIGYQF